MNQNVEQLLSAVKAKAGNERADILSDAEANKRKIIAEADAEIEKMQSEADRQMEKEIRVESDRILGSARAERRNRLLRVKREIVDDAFSRAREKLTELCKSKEYPKISKALVREAVDAVGGDGKVETGKSLGTIIVSTKNGHRRVDNSLMTRLTRVETTGIDRVARRIFGQ